jgi:starch-binding outer membrane protein SusE/F
MNKKLLLLVICFLTFSFANAQLSSVAIVGPGAGGWPTGALNEVDAHQMTSTDGVTWTLNNLALTAGSVKFRGNNSWAPYDWGGTAFPSGTALYQNSAGIPTAQGIYNVTFNINTLAYTFDRQGLVISIIGSVLSPDWSIEKDLTTTDGNIYTIKDVLLVPGELKLRGNHSWDWPYDWGGAFPSGTAAVQGGAIIIPTAGKYDITFNKTTLAYNITTSALGVSDFDTITFKAYPNPTQNNWTFSSQENIESIVIVDIAGKTIKTVAPKSNQANVDASGLTAGVYFAKVTTAKASQTLKLIKQ